MSSAPSPSFRAAPLRLVAGPFGFDDDDLGGFEPPVERPLTRDEIDALLDQVLDEELERLRELEIEMERPPN